jgi:hypothetical protein
MAKTMTTTTQFQEVYAIIFDQQGLMAGLGPAGIEDQPVHSEVKGPRLKRGSSS